MGTSSPHLYIFGGYIILALMAQAMTAGTAKKQDTVVTTKMTKSEPPHRANVAMPSPTLGHKRVITANAEAEESEATEREIISRRLRRTQRGDSGERGKRSSGNSSDSTSEENEGTTERGGDTTERGGDTTEGARDTTTTTTTVTTITTTTTTAATTTTTTTPTEAVTTETSSPARITSALDSTDVDAAAVAAGVVVGVIAVVVVVVVVAVWLLRTRRNHPNILTKRQAYENTTYTNGLESGQNSAPPETSAYLSLQYPGKESLTSDYQALVNNNNIDGNDSSRRNAAMDGDHSVSTEVQDKVTISQRLSLNDDDDMILEENELYEHGPEPGDDLQAGSRPDPSVRRPGNSSGVTSDSLRKNDVEDNNGNDDDDDDMTIEENDLYEQGPEPQDGIQAGSGDHSSTHRPEDNSRIYGPSDGPRKDQVDCDEEDSDDDDMTLEENDLYEQGPQSG